MSKVAPSVVKRILARAHRYGMSVKLTSPPQAAGAVIRERKLIPRGGLFASALIALEAERTSRLADVGILDADKQEINDEIDAKIETAKATAGWLDLWDAVLKLANDPKNLNNEASPDGCYTQMAARRHYGLPFRLGAEASAECFPPFRNYRSRCPLLRNGRGLAPTDHRFMYCGGKKSRKLKWVEVFAGTDLQEMATAWRAAHPTPQAEVPATTRSSKGKRLLPLDHAAKAAHFKRDYPNGSFKDFAQYADLTPGHVSRLYHAKDRLFRTAWHGNDGVPAIEVSPSRRRSSRIAAARIHAEDDD
jgi:hypothetical protein